MSYRKGLQSPGRFAFLAFLLAALCTATADAGAAGWLSVSGNHIVDASNVIWVGRGANLMDTRSCGAATSDSGAPLDDNDAGVAEVKRRIDLLTDGWKANFIRLTLESRRTQDTYVNDANYRARIKQIVDYIGTKSNVYVLLGIWIDPSINAQGWPTAGTNSILAKLATDYYSYPYVMFGVSNEPEDFDGQVDPPVWTAMNNAVAAIRTAEALQGTNRHIVTVQGTHDWARDLSYYVTHPITAGGGVNVAYETHIYNSPGDFAGLLAPATTRAVIIGEFGPINEDYAQASVADLQTLIDLAKSKGIPHLAWAFHHYCPPNLIADQPNQSWNSNSTSDNWFGMPMYPTDFGQFLIDNWKTTGGPGVIQNTTINFNVTSSDDNKTRPGTALVTKLDNFGAEKRPVVVLLPGWGGLGDVAPARSAQSTLFANNGYVALDVGFHMNDLGEWNSDVAEGVKAALDTLCALTYVNCAAIVLVGESYGGTQTHPVIRYLRDTGTYDGGGGANALRRVVAFLGQDSGYTLYWDPLQAADADATAYSIAMIQNQGDQDFPIDSCGDGNCGIRNRANYHRTAAGSQFVLSQCPAGGSHELRGYADWDAWVLSAVKTMLHNHRGIAKFTGYVEPTVAVSNACGAPSGQVSCDIDGNSKYEPLTDGLMLVRYLFGLTGNALVSNALGGGATITDPVQVLARLNAMRPQLDIDDNGLVEPLSDGLLLIRYLFNLRGAALINGALGAGARRTTATQIEDYIKTLLP